MDIEDNSVVDGYLFKNPRKYERAKKEYNNILKIKKKINPENTEELYQLYIKLVSNNVFVTPVGLGFLHEMREYLKETHAEDTLLPVPITEEKVMKPAGIDGMFKDKYEKILLERERLLAANKRLIVAVVSFVIIVIGMIFIVVTNDNLGYFNAEEKVLDKYSAWEERLQTWEEELIEREDELENIRN